MKKWEYAVKSFDSDDDTQAELNKYGAYGWELVAVVAWSWVDARKDYQHSGSTFYFKRMSGNDK